MNNEYADPLARNSIFDTRKVVEAKHLEDVQKQLEILHGNIWMLRDKLLSLSLQLAPIRDTRLNPEPVHEVPQKDDYHCELASGIMDEAETVHGCLNFVQELMKSLQI